MPRRVLAFTVVIVTAILLQSTIFSQVKLLGAEPELLYLVTIVVAAIEGPREGAIFGFAGGMAEDFFLNQPKGITALTLTLLGYSIGLARQYIVSPSPLLPTLLVFVGTLGGVVFAQVLAFLLGEVDVGTLPILRIAVLSATYGGILTPIAFPVLKRIFEGSRPRRVVRF